MKVLFSLHPCQHSWCLMCANLCGRRWYLIVFICISMKISHTEHFFMCVLAYLYFLTQAYFPSSKRFYRLHLLPFSHAVGLSALVLTKSKVRTDSLSMVPSKLPSERQWHSLNISFFLTIKLKQPFHYY